MAAVQVHLAEKNMGRGIAGVEVDRLLERQHRGIGAVRPHADEAECEMSWRVSGIETNGALSELIGLDVVERDVICPAQIGGVAMRDRQLHCWLRILSVYLNCTAK